MKTMEEQFDEFLDNHQKKSKLQANKKGILQEIAKKRRIELAQREPESIEETLKRLEKKLNKIMDQLEIEE